MANGNAPRLYAAEIKLMQARGIEVNNDVSVSSAANGNGSDQTVLAAINDLKRLIEKRIPVDPDVPEVDDADGNDNAENETAAQSDQLKTEIRALSRSIQETKAEISALGVRNTDGSKLETASNELDAVVQATENATNDILTANEKIDDLAQQLLLNASDDGERQLAEEILENTVKAFEACNFQDITGQRISKVVNALKFIEDRIDSMIDIWGKEEIDAAATTQQDENDPDADLLNGPAMDGQGISQDDIDALFD